MLLEPNQPIYDPNLQDDYEDLEEEDVALLHALCNKPEEEQPESPDPKEGDEEGEGEGEGEAEEPVAVADDKIIAALRRHETQIKRKLLHQW